MEKRKAVLSIILVLVVLLFGFLIVAGVSDAHDYKAYHDINIYIQQQYHNKEVFGDKVYSLGVSADNFMPEYDEIEYNYSDIDFYIYNGTATMTKTAVTFALDLKFNDKDEYESAKSFELSAREFMTEYKGKQPNKSIFEFELGDFLCKTVEGNGYPRCAGFICLNDSKLVLRYLIFEEWESPESVKDARYISGCTNCPWKI